MGEGALRSPGGLLGGGEKCEVFEREVGERGGERGGEVGGDNGDFRGLDGGGEEIEDGKEHCNLSGRGDEGEEEVVSEFAPLERGEDVGEFRFLDVREFKDCEKDLGSLCIVVCFNISGLTTT